ncbi:hypothetical protein NECAME_06370 [Necator americanus]|uniref:Uncharacterized protein n=1 Tax=Necator americanus TaxID=51031 RepID=W2TUE3_NECAM|nr:hypothetical protein NECAME_06370 [Necator americanus]ETN85418.1 hypothetical protein NECAME_06370 [Necator americanus]
MPFGNATEERASGKPAPDEAMGNPIEPGIKKKPTVYDGNKDQRLELTSPKPLLSALDLGNIQGRVP